MSFGFHQFPATSGGRRKQLSRKSSFQAFRALSEMKISLLALLLLAGALDLCSSSRILVLIPMPAKSHYNLGERLIEELVKRGHQVTILAPFKKSKPLPNLTEIILPDISEELFKGSNPNSKEGKFGMRNMSPLAFLEFSKLGGYMVDRMLGFESVQKLKHSNQKFDLVFGECFLQEAMLAGFSHHFKAPIVSLATFMPNVWANEMVGNPYPSSYVPDPILGYTDKMNFQERLINFLYTTLSQFHHYHSHLPRQNEVMKKHFGQNLPYITDILSNTSLMLVNHHYSLAFPRPYLPNMVEIGGYHVSPPKALPQELQKFMDDAKEGVIYFSMGSNLQSSEFPEEKFKGILRAFSKLKQRVLWKFESTNPPDLPKNVKISKWLPQSDILAHPNTKLFITHGGLLSFVESVLRGVPVVGIPIFGDQPLNVKYVVKMELGVKIEYDDLGEESLYQAIQEVLNNPKYRNNMKTRSVLLQDVAMSQIDTAIYWIEYVIRYKGAPHLRSEAQALAWYELYLLDVYAFLAAVTFVVFFVVYKCLCCVSRTLCGGGKRKEVPPRKKNN